MINFPAGAGWSPRQSGECIFLALVSAAETHRVSKEQQFAEKLHAYALLPGPSLPYGLLLQKPPSAKSRKPQIEVQDGLAQYVINLEVKRRTSKPLIGDVV
jgi:hypothetical protein